MYERLADGPDRTHTESRPVPPEIRRFAMVLVIAVVLTSILHAIDRARDGSGGVPARDARSSAGTRGSAR
jgi:hypothetical protein